MSANELMAGVGRADISPKTDIQLAGWGNKWRGSQGVDNPLSAKALVVAGAGGAFCFVSADVCGITSERSAPLRAEIAAMLGTTPDGVMIHGSQTHSGPFIGNYLLRGGNSPYVTEDAWWLHGNDPRYDDTFRNGVLSAVGRAKEGMRRCSIKATRGMDGRISWNRRFVLRDGSGAVHPGNCYMGNLRPAGWADPDVSIVAFCDKAGAPFAAVVHHTSHPSHGFGHSRACSDWPGVWSAAVGDLLGNGCVALCANGACGDICTYNHVDPEANPSLEKTVGMLMQTTKRVLGSLTEIRSDVFGWHSRVVKIPMRRIGQWHADMASIRLEKNPKPVWDEPGMVNGDWFRDVVIRDYFENAQRSPVYQCEIQAMRAGDFMLVGWPGEPFVDLQFNVKLKSPSAFTVCAHMCNDQAGYIATAETFAGGGGSFDLDTGNNSKLEPQALKMMEEETKRAMLDLY